MSEWVETEIRVRYAETDAMGMAHHANYFIWFESARAAYCRAKGIDYIQMEKEGLFLPVADARCRFRLPTYYEDVLKVRIRVSGVKRSLVHFDYQILRPSDNALIAEGETIQALIGRDGKLKSFPQELRDLFAEGN